MPRNLKLEVSDYLIILLEQFGEISGFDVVIQLLQRDKSVDYGNIKMALKPIFISRAFLTSNFLEEFCPKIKTIIFDRMLTSSGDKLTTEQKVNQIDVQQYLQKILAEISSEEKVAEMFEHFNLELGYRCFREESLAKRLRGLQLFRDVILKTYKEEKKLGAQIGDFLSNLTKVPEEDKEKEKKVFFCRSAICVQVVA